MTQSSLSRIERREDNPIETLRNYVEPKHRDGLAVSLARPGALGGELEVVGVLGNIRVKLLGV